MAVSLSGVWAAVGHTLVGGEVWAAAGRILVGGRVWTATHTPSCDQVETGQCLAKWCSSVQFVSYFNWNILFSFSLVSILVQSTHLLSLAAGLVGRFS